MITLTTDFGDSPYVGAMKGAILSLHPSSAIVDITHSIPPHDVTAGAFVLLSAVVHFPPGTIHVAVVDPGVGTSRRALLLECSRGYLVGPDNGVLVPAARALGLQRSWEIPIPPGASPTFHGRDVFAPAAARLDRGEPPEEIAEKGPPPTGDPLPPARPLKGGGFESKIAYVDRFGNAITLAGAEALPPWGTRVRVVAGKRSFRGISTRTYEDHPPGTLLLLVGSSGFVEISVTRGSAYRRMGRPQNVRVEW